MSRSLLVAICVACIVVFGGYTFCITLMTSGAPISFTMTLTLDYEGQQSGRATLVYQWTSQQSQKDTLTIDVDWQQVVAKAAGSTSNDIERKIMEYLGEAVADLSSINIHSDGSWTMSLSFTIGGSLPIGFLFTGNGSTVNNVAVSSSVSLLPSGLKSSLRQLGVTNLDLQAQWNLYISGDFLKDWAKNAFGLLNQIWATVNKIADSSSRAIGSIVP